MPPAPSVAAGAHATSQQNQPKDHGRRPAHQPGRPDSGPLLRDQVERVITVSEQEIMEALRLTWERAKLMIEPSSAVAVAAVLTEGFRGMDGLRRVGVVLSGGNVSMEMAYRP